MSDIPPGLVGVPAREWMWTWAAADLLNLQAVLPLGSLTRVLSNGWSVARKRDQLASDMLQAGMRWLMFLDTDQTFRLDIVHRLWATSEQTGAGIVAAPVTGRNRQDVRAGTVNAFRLDAGYRAPDPLNLADDADWRKAAEQVRAEEIDRSGEALEVDLVMTGATLFRREVFEAVTGPPWFIASRHVAPGAAEDVNFSYRARDAGVKQVIDPSVRVGHLDLFDFQVEDAAEWSRAYAERQVVGWTASGSCGEPLGCDRSRGGGSNDHPERCAMPEDSSKPQRGVNPKCR